MVGEYYSRSHGARRAQFPEQLGGRFDAGQPGADDKRGILPGRARLRREAPDVGIEPRGAVVGIDIEGKFAEPWDFGADEPAAELVAERLLGALREPFTIGSNKVRSGASIGIAMSGEGIGLDELLRHADVAMYAAKRAGKGRVERYEPSQDTTLLDR